MLFAPLLLASCGKFSDGTSIWQGGLWAIPTITTIGTIVFLFLAYKASQSGSKIQTKDERGVAVTKYSDENVPIYKTGYFIFFIGFLIATIAIIITVNAEK